MADPLINLLQSRTVLIRAGNAVGTGTLIAPGMILTCAHVVRRAWNNKEIIKASLPDPSIPGQFIWEESAQEVYLSNVYEEKAPELNDDVEATQITLKTEYPDVAVIKISHTEHALIELPVNDNDNVNLENGQFLAFGFQKRDANLDRNVPQTVSLTYEGAQLDGTIKKLMFTHGLVRPGMSGAALVERGSGKIIGLVHMTRSANDNLGAYVIPAEAIWNVIKKWEDDRTNDLYSLLRSKRHKFRIDKEYFKEFPRFPMFKKYGIKLFVFLVLLVLFLWWFSFHVGQPQDSGLFAIVLAAISIFGIFLGNWLGRDVRNETRRAKSNFGKLFLRSGVLISAAIFIFLAWNFNSSIWIYGNSEHNKIPVSLYTGDNFEHVELKMLDSTGRIRFFRPIVFKGDSAKLVPEGREPKIITLKPYSRQVLYYPKDFLLEPVILIRFDPNYLSLMRKFIIQIEIDEENAREDEHKFVHLDSMLTNEGSLVVGARHLEFSKKWEDEWKDFFQGKIPSSMLNGWIAKWKNTKRFHEVDLNLGDKVKVIVIKKSDSTIMNEQSYSIKTDNTDKLIKFNFQ